MAWVSAQKPTAKLLDVNSLGRCSGLRPGMQYSVALSVVPELRAECLSEQDSQAATEQLTGLLRKFSPELEVGQEQSGVFWLGASGLEPLFGSLEEWAEELAQELARQGWMASLTVGFSRFGSYAVGLTSEGVQVLEEAAHEQKRALQSELSRFGLEVATLLALEQLGVRRLKELLALPANGLRERFGSQVFELHRQAAGGLWSPLQLTAEVEPFRLESHFDYVQPASQGLLFLVKRLLDPLLARLMRRGLGVEVLHLEFFLEEAPVCHTHLKLAYPSLERRKILELVRLRLDNLELASGVVGLAVEVEPTALEREQLSLFELDSRRCQADAERALARLRAEFGEQAVVRVRLQEGHLPAAAFLFEPWQKSSRKGSPQPYQPVRIRRFHRQPEPLKGRVALAQELPIRLSGGWWRSEYDRDYHYGKSGPKLLWLYREQGEWFVQGLVQ